MRIVQLCLAGAVCLLTTESAHAEFFENFDRLAVYSKLPLGPTSNPYQPYFDFWKSSSSMNSVPTIYNGVEVATPKDHYVGIQYPGYGIFQLSMGGQPIIIQDYHYAQVDFFDDGTRDYGMLFQVYNTDGRWWAIAVNDNVARGKYYFRTDQNVGNTGTVIEARRDGAAATGNWHRLVISKWGDVYVDGIAGGTLSGLGDAPIDTMRVQGAWGKPADRLFFDNWQIGNGVGAHVLKAAASMSTDPDKMKNDCTYNDGTPIDADHPPLKAAVDPQENSTYIYNTDPTFSIEVRCPVDLSAARGGFISPMSIKVQDGYNGPQSAAVDFHARMVFTRNGVTTNGPLFNRVWQDYNGAPSWHLDLPYQQVPVYAVAEGSQAYISVRLQPMKNGKQTKLYYYRYLVHNGIGEPLTYDWNRDCADHPCF